MFFDRISRMIRYREVSLLKISIYTTHARNSLGKWRESF